MKLNTRVLARDPARFDMTGRKLTGSLHYLAEAISPGLAHRLFHYAHDRMIEAGFGPAIEGWQAEVYTIDGDEKPANRSYCVRWRNPQGGYLELIGILTRHGWPSLDHGFDIGFEKP